MYGLGPSKIYSEELSAKIQDGVRRCLRKNGVKLLTRMVCISVLTVMPSFNNYLQGVHDLQRSIVKLMMTGMDTENSVLRALLTNAFYEYVLLYNKY